MYCVCQHTDPGMADTQRLDHLRSGLYKDGIRARLTVGRDPRNRKALG